MRHEVRYRHSPRGITPRRLAAAKRALKRERDRLALFADEVAREQPSPEERIESFDDRGMRAERAMRDLAARHWRWGRRQLELVSDDVRQQILCAWNRSMAPPSAHYFADYVRTRLKRLGISPVEDAT